MKILLLCLTYLAIASAETSKWKDFRVKYSPVSTGIDVDSFWKIHSTLNEAYSNGWVAVTTPSNLNVVIVCRSTRDLRLCPIYDSNGFIAGMQLGVPADDVEGKDVPYNLNNFPIYEKKSINEETYWTSTYYLVNPETIAAGGRNNSDLIGEGIWLKNGTSYTEIPTDEDTINNTSSYTWQNCIPSMGKHYYNNMTPLLDCEEFEPFFLLAQDGDMVGIGWQFLGKTTFVDHDWYDYINGQAVQMTVPLGPKCLSEGADKYGVISIHMFFINEPWNIPCNQETDSVVPLGFDARH